ncbi:MAG: hypothetical protein HUJ77_09455 [Clostridium sp.]|uniref:hypothetical protein n=1 Tax=Clostridium sp. TaxID=1506 RepID=UPI0025C437C8|nr:hypothetical protein [Clostridium sp.]MCF0148609.1 hypothetical protein [Clostridium sp.]
MDRKLIEKIIGKKYYVDLNDEIYILRDITSMMREKIVFKESFSEEVLNTIKCKALKSKNTVDSIVDGLENDKFAIGYTNSKIYLLKYLKDIQFNLNKMLENCNLLKQDELIIYTNSLIDLILLF